MQPLRVTTAMRNVATPNHRTEMGAQPESSGDFIDPVKVIAGLRIQQGSTVVDFGTGSGAYALAAAQALQGTGHVLAIDVMQDMLAKLRSTAQTKGYKNIQTLWGNIELEGGSKVASETADLVILSNVIFQAEDKIRVFQEAHRILKKGGRLLLIDWSDSFSHMGPHPKAVVSEALARKFLDKASFAVSGTVYAGAHHYGLLAKPVYH
jgi:ubiquinone/menaquinone biosynthesis C-methylase UbiE